MFSLFLVTQLPHIVHTLGHVLLIEVDLGICKLEFHDFINIAWVDLLGDLVFRMSLSFRRTLIAYVNVDAFLH